MNLITTEKNVILIQHENTACIECSGWLRAYAFRWTAGTKIYSQLLILRYLSRSSQPKRASCFEAGQNLESFVSLDSLSNKPSMYV